MKIAKKDNRKNTANTLEKILDNILNVYGIIGLFTQDADNFVFEMKKKYLGNLEIDESYIESKINQRTEAKKNKEFDVADNIRAELDEKGIILMDTVDGTKWDIKALFNTQS